MLSGQRRSKSAHKGRSAPSGHTFRSQSAHRRTSSLKAQSAPAKLTAKSYVKLESPLNRNEQINGMADTINIWAGAFFASLEHLVKPANEAERNLFAHLWIIHLKNAAKFWKLPDSSTMDDLKEIELRTRLLLKIDSTLNETPLEERKAIYQQGLQIHQGFWRRAAGGGGQIGGVIPKWITAALAGLAGVRAQQQPSPSVAASAQPYPSVGSFPPSPSFSPSFTVAPSATYQPGGIQAYQQMGQQEPQSVVGALDAYKQRGFFDALTTSGKPGQSSRQRVRAKVATARDRADEAMGKNPVTQGVVKWMQLQSVKSIIAYSQYDGYQITETTLPPEGTWIPGEQAQNQINLLKYPGYYIGDITIVFVKDESISKTLKKTLGYTGPEGGTNDIEAIYFDIMAAKNKTDIDSAVNRILSLKKEKAVTQRKVTDTMADLRQKKASLAQEVKGAGQRETALKGIMDEVGLKKLVGRITASSVSKAAIKTKNPFLSVTRFYDDDEEERGPFIEGEADPIGSALALYDTQLDVISNSVVQISEMESRLKEIDTLIVEAERVLDEPPEKIIGVFVPTNKASVMDTIVRKYMEGTGTELELRVASLPSYTPNIFTDGFKKRKQMIRTSASPALARSLEKRAAWGEQEFIGLLEDYQQGIQSYKNEAEKLDLHRIEADVEKGLIAREVPGQLQVAKVELSRQLGVFNAAIKSVTSQESDDTITAIAKAYITDIGVEEASFESEADKNIVKSITDGIHTRGEMFIQSLDEVAQEGGRAISNAGINIAKTGAWYTSSALIALGIFVFDLFFMKSERAEIIGHTFPKPNTATQVMTVVGGGALGIAAYYLGGATLLGVLKTAGGAMLSYMTGTGGIISTVSASVGTALLYPDFARALLMGCSSILGSVGTLILFYANILKGGNLYLPTIVISALVKVLTIYIDSTVYGQISNLNTLRDVLAKKMDVVKAGSAEAAVLSDRLQEVKRQLDDLYAGARVQPPVLVAPVAQVAPVARPRSGSRARSRSRAVAAPVAAPVSRARRGSRSAAAPPAPAPYFPTGRWQMEGDRGGGMRNRTRRLSRSGK